MNQNSLFNSRGFTALAGGACFLVSLKPEIVISNPQLLRPLLNVSWGYAFGSHIWSFFYNKNLINWKKKILLENKSSPAQEIMRSRLENNESRIYRMYLESLISTNVISNGILLIATVSLAPSNKMLKFCSGTALLLSIGNILFALPEDEMDDESVGVVKVSSSSCFLSEMFSFFTFGAIIPYVFA